MLLPADALRHLGPSSLGGLGLAATGSIFPAWALGLETVIKKAGSSRSSGMLAFFPRGFYMNQCTAHYALFVARTVCVRGAHYATQLSLLCLHRRGKLMH